MFTCSLDHFNEKSKYFVFLFVFLLCSCSFINVCIFHIDCECGHGEIATNRVDSIHWKFSCIEEAFFLLVDMMDKQFQQDNTNSAIFSHFHPKRDYWTWEFWTMFSHFHSKFKGPKHTTHEQLKQTIALERSCIVFQMLYIRLLSLYLFVRNPIAHFQLMEVNGSWKSLFQTTVQQNQLKEQESGKEKERIKKKRVKPLIHWMKEIKNLYWANTMNEEKHSLLLLYCCCYALEAPK